MQEKTSVFSDFPLKNQLLEEGSGVEAGAEEASEGTEEETSPRAEISAICTRYDRKIQRPAVILRQFSFIQKVQKIKQLFLKRGGGTELQQNTPIIQNFGII